METETIIRMTNLTRKFAEVTAVDRLNLEVQRGEIFGLVGPDGAGKTTTLRLLCGLIDPTEGSAWVAGHDVQTEPAAVRDQIGYMAQRFGLYADLTVDENMEFYSDLFGVSAEERDQLLPDLLQMTRMEPFRKRAAGKLSGGMKQKLALMCTLLHRPQILFLDEPTTGVDPVSRRDFWTILDQLVHDGITVFVTTAYMDEAERCHRVALIDKGRFIRVESPDMLRQRFEDPCYAIHGAQLRKAREALQSMDGVESVEPSGPVLHLFLDPERTSPDVLKKGVEAQGFGPLEFELVTPSLEDVFIAMVRKQEALHE
jgi:drug efflux transport system ATP-binding protein